jgi:hypothetical protein
LGADWAWLFEKVKNDRLGLLRKLFRGEYIEQEDVWKYEKRPKVKQFLDDRRPPIDGLPDNKGYITYPDGEVRLQRFEMPSFHHKLSLEDFSLDSGITWTVSKKKTIEKKEPNSSDKKVREQILQKIDYMVQTEKKSFKQVREDLIQMETDGVIPNFGCSEKDSKYFNNMYLKWKKIQNNS